MIKINFSTVPVQTVYVFEQNSSRKTENDTMYLQCKTNTNATDPVSITWYINDLHYDTGSNIQIELKKKLFKAKIYCEAANLGRPAVQSKVEELLFYRKSFCVLLHSFVVNMYYNM